MEVTVIGKRPKAGTSPGVKLQQDAGTDFSAVMGKVLNSDGNAKTPQKASKAQNSQNLKSDGTKAKEDGGEEQQESDQAAGTGSSQLTAAAQELAGMGQIAVQIPTDSAPSPGGEESAGSEMPAQSAAPTQASAEPAEVLTPEGFTAHVKAELRQSAQSFQTQLHQAVQEGPAVQAAPEVQEGLAVQPASTEGQAAPEEQLIQPEAQPASGVQSEQTVQESPSAQTVQGSESEAPVKQGSADKRIKTPEGQKPAAPGDPTAQPQENVQPVAAKPQGETDGNSAAQSGKSDQDGGAESAGMKKTDGAKAAAPQLSQAAFQTPAQAQMRETADLQEAVDRALVQFDRDFQGMKGDAKNLEISLHPKELGSVSISLAAGAGGVTAKIRTSSAEAASLLSAQVQRMIASMEDKGVRVQNVEVVLTQTPQQDGGNGRGEDTQRQYQDPSGQMGAAVRPAAEKIAAADYEWMTEACTAPMEEGQRVEYRI